jgi:hypothetical protein
MVQVKTCSQLHKQPEKRLDFAAGKVFNMPDAECEHQKWGIEIGF